MADARGQGHNVPKFSSFKGRRDGRDERSGKDEQGGIYGQGDSHRPDDRYHAREDRHGRGERDERGGRFGRNHRDEHDYGDERYHRNERDDRYGRSYRDDRDYSDGRHRKDERDYSSDNRDRHGGRDDHNSKQTRNPNRLGCPPSSWKGKRILEQRRREEERRAQNSRPNTRDDDPFPGRSDLSRLKDRDPFIVDYKGDKNNLSYGEIDPYSVPIYYRPHNSLLVGKRTAVKVQQVASFSMDDLFEPKPKHDDDGPDFETAGQENASGEEELPDFMEIEDPVEKGKNV